MLERRSDLSGRQGSALFDIGGVMKIEIDLPEGELLYDILEKTSLVYLKSILDDLRNPTGYVHPDDKVMNKKIIKAINTILEYHGERVE